MSNQNDADVSVTGTGDLRPVWVPALMKILADARKDGWYLTGFDPQEGIIFEGYPYLLDGEPALCRWSFDIPMDL